MRIPWCRAGVVLAVAAGLAVTASWAVPSKYVKQQAIKKVDGLLAKAEPLTARHAKLKDEGKLDKLSTEDRDQTLGFKVAVQLRQAYDDALDGYFAAAQEGWPETDPDMARMRAALEAAREKFEACGFWSAIRFGEQPIGPFKDRLEKMRDLAAIAGGQLRNQQVDEAKGTLDDLDKRLAHLKLELDKAEDEGPALPLTLKHPAYQRTLAEIARLRGQEAGVIAAKDQERAGVDQDVEKLLAAFDKLEPLLAMTERLINTGGTEEQRAEAFTQGFAQIAAWEAADRAATEQLVKDFGAKYGTTLQDIEHKLTTLKGGPLGYRRTPGNVYEQMVKGLASVAETRRAAARKLCAEAAKELDWKDELSEFIRVAMVEKQRPKLEMALKFDPENAEAKARLAGLDAEKQACAAAIEKAIDGRKWGSSITTFTGPGKVDALLASALAWVKANNDQPGQTCIAIRLVGEWFVFEKDALGRPAAYGLPVEVVWVQDADKAAGKDLAKVYELSMVTSTAKQAAPFKLAAVGGSWWIRASKVK